MLEAVHKAGVRKIPFLGVQEFKVGFLFTLKINPEEL